MFLIQVITSFVVGGLFIALQTTLGERVPLRWRGVILTLPSTLALGLFFIGLTKGVNNVPEAAGINPAALGPDYLFVLCFAFFSQFNLTAGFIGSFGFWIISAALLLHFPPASLGLSIFAYGLPIILLCYCLVNILPQFSQITPVPMTWLIIIMRSLIGGLVVASIVVFAKTLGNLWGGLFSAFPAAFSSTFLIYYLAYGKKIIPSVAKSMFFPGAIGFIVYAIVAGLAFPRYGIWLGTLAAYLASLPCYYIYTQTLAFIKTRLTGSALTF